MSIPVSIKIKNDLLPDSPGVYFYYDTEGTLLYIGKATSLKRRVGSYFTKAHDNRIAELVSRIVRIEYLETPTVIEALVLEANQIKKFKPPYNIMQRDDKSFLYLVITNELYPKPLFVRGHDLASMGIQPFRSELSEAAQKKFLRIFGPYTSSRSLKMALELIRKVIPWSTCEPPSITGKTRPCFYVHLRQCPGVCTGAISPKDYRKIIRHLILFFEGKKMRIRSELEKEMLAFAKQEKFEEAEIVKRRIYALDHIQDIALVSRDDYDLIEPYQPNKGIDLNGRIEGYDISNISGTSAVGSMVVFEDGQPLKSAYRKFKIKTVIGANDFAMMGEVMRRRLKRFSTLPEPPPVGGVPPKAGGGSKGGGSWPLPQIMVIDGGEGQVQRVREIMEEMGIDVPFIGIAKGFDRKQDRLVYDSSDERVAAVAQRGKELFQKVRDESHRFAVKYHRTLRQKKFIDLRLLKKKSV